jgi:arabinose-5-phosphate isomerase
MSAPRVTVRMGGGAATGGPDVEATLARAREVIRLEAEGVAGLAERLDQGFARAVELLLACRTKAIVSGVGKSGAIAARIAATLTSTGTPSIHLHPADALHGDLGLFTPGDVAVFISKSGSSEELMALLPFLERMGIPLVAITADAGSPLGRRAQATIATGPVREACPMDLTPTTSLLQAQAVGDGLAVVLLERRGFKAEDFRFLHPGGVIGARASRRVDEIMHRGDEIPVVKQGAILREAVIEIMDKRLGITTVVDEQGRLAGVLSDGDFKRILMKHSDPWGLTAAEVMSRTPRTIEPDALVAAAVRRMEENPGGPITALVILDAERRPVGLLHLHDCLRV